MSLVDLLAWIRDPALSQADPHQGRLLVMAARAELDDADPRDEPLYAIELALHEGGLPTELLRDFEHRFGLGETQIPYGNRLEMEYRRLAAEMPESEWLTVFYDEALGAVDFAEAGQTEKFLSTIKKMRETVVKAWEPYAQTALMDEDVTAETVVGHLLLQDGVEGWLVALDQLERAAKGELTYDEALLSAERANRLMVAIQKLSLRVEQAAPTSAFCDEN